MSKVKIQGNASGTGVLTVTAPNTSTDRTITLPDATGTLLNSDGDGSSLTGVGVAGISSSADATAITINSSENVGIGDTDPSEAKLSITGVQAGDVGVKIDHDIVDTHALQIAADTTTARGVDVECNALTTGHVAKFYSNSSDTSTRQVFVVKNDHVNSTGTTALYVDNDSTGLVADFEGAGGIRSAGGIKFGTDTAATNTLDDYEEGTFTPVFKDTSNAVVNGTLYNASYTKIGQMVFISLYYSPGDVQNGYLMNMSLPFTASSANHRSAGSLWTYNAPIPEKSNQWLVQTNTAHASFWKLRDNQISPTMQWDNGTEIVLSIAYFTSQ